MNIDRLEVAIALTFIALLGWHMLNVTPTLFELNLSALK